MEIELNPIEARVLGSLLEKSMTTPDYYPLTLRALTTACNQKSNRNPVMELDEADVVRAVDSLREKRLVVESPSGRVMKYAEIFVNAHNLIPAEAAVLTVLLLRGPQTLGELRTRTERAHAFASLDEVEQVLADLAETGMVVKLPRQPGQKERRYAHLFSGEPEMEAAAPAPEPARLVVQAENERLAALEAELAAVRDELAALRREFDLFRKEFE